MRWDDVGESGALLRAYLGDDFPPELEREVIELLKKSYESGLDEMLEEVSRGIELNGKPGYWSRLKIAIAAHYGI